MSSEVEHTMRAYYGDDAPALWRRRHPKDRRIGPRPGELAIEVHGPQSVIEMDVAAAVARPDIGLVWSTLGADT